MKLMSITYHTWAGDKIESQNAWKDSEVSHKGDVSRSDLDGFLWGLPTKESE